jgi:hypothetical protein
MKPSRLRGARALLPDEVEPLTAKVLGELRAAAGGFLGQRQWTGWLYRGMSRAEFGRHWADGTMHWTVDRPLAEDHAARYPDGVVIRANAKTLIGLGIGIGPDEGVREDLGVTSWESSLQEGGSLSLVGPLESVRARAAIAPPRGSHADAPDSRGIPVPSKATKGLRAARRFPDRTLSDLPDDEIEARPGDIVFPVRGALMLAGVIRGGRVIGWLNVGGYGYRDVLALYPEVDWHRGESPPWRHGQDLEVQGDRFVAREGSRSRKALRKAARKGVPPGVSRGPNRPFDTGAIGEPNWGRIGFASTLAEATSRYKQFETEQSREARHFLTRLARLQFDEERIAGRGRGSRTNGGGEEQRPTALVVQRQLLEPEVIEEPFAGTAVPQLRRRADVALPDTVLWGLIASQGDVLSGMTFEQAVVEDPRRIDALISQQIGLAFAEVFGVPAGPEAGELYLMGIDFARQAHGGELPVRALVSLVEENMDRALFATFPRMPVFARAELRRRLPVFDAALDAGAAIARRAQTIARARGLGEDSQAWRDLADYLEGHKDMIRHALAQGLPGPVARPMLPLGRRMLPGPRRR